MFDHYLAKNYENRAAIKKALGLPAPWQTNILWNAGLLKNLIALMSPQLLALRAAGLVGKNINITFALRQCIGSFPPPAACLLPGSQGASFSVASSNPVVIEALGG